MKGNKGNRKKKHPNLTGQRFSQLTVLEYKGTDKNRNALWLCRCDCGNEKVVRARHLKNGHTKSCGCLGPRFIDLTSMRFERLVVIAQQEERDKQGNVLWLCKCDCGQTTIATSHGLRSGRTQSCGCLAKERRREALSLPEGIGAMHGLLTTYKWSATHRGLAWKLTEDEFHQLTSGPCFYCGQPPSQVTHLRTCNGQYTYNGIDRIDSEKGYLSSNVVSCCGWCNNAKRTLSQIEFYQNLKRAYEHLGLQDLD